MERSRSFCFTWNNPDEETEASLARLGEEQGTKYLCFGREVGEQGTPHLQGFVMFRNPRSARAVSAMFPRWHTEIKRGTLEQAIKYCEKDGDFQEYGERPKTPKEKGAAERERWESAWNSAKAGLLEEISPSKRIRYYSAIRKIGKDYMSKPSDLETVCGVWIYGPPGVGKSFGARRDFPEAYLKPCNKWWDGYQGEDFVILDDFDLNHRVLGHHLKIWADRYSFIGENKGSGMHIRPKKIVVTSNYAIEEIFRDDERLAEALRRRFEVIYLEINQY